MSKRGYLIVSIGDVAYSKFATNLAVSLRARSKLPITLLTDGVSFVRKELYDHVITVSSHDCYRFVMKDGNHKGIEPGLLKLKLDQYTPFDETLYIDADSACINYPDSMFERHTSPFCSYHEGTIPRAHTGRHKRMIWASMDEVSKYIERDLIALNSSVILFRKDAKPIFDRAREVSKLDIPYKKWGSAHPDELYFNIAVTNNIELFSAIDETDMLKGVKRNVTGYNDYTFVTLFGSGNQMNYATKQLYRNTITEAGKLTGYKVYPDINSLARRKHVTVNK